MPRLYRRKPDVVEAVQFFSGRTVPGVEWRRGEKGDQMHRGVWTTAGWTTLKDGDWILTDANGDRSVLSDPWFRVGYEPVDQ